MGAENNTPDDSTAGSGEGGGLSIKKQAFTAAYHELRNATQAAIRAGYSVKTAQQQGSRLLKDAGVKAELARLAAEQVESDSTPPQPQKKGVKPRTITSTPAPGPQQAQPPVNISEQLLARQGALDPEQPLPATTPTEEAFITEYLRNGMNGTAAWMFTHPGSTPMQAGCYAARLLKKGRVADRIAAERQRLARKHEMDRDELLGQFLAIVRADPNELTQMRCVACGTCWPGEERKGRWIDPDPECADCMGEGNSAPWFADTRKLSPEALALFAGVKLTAAGVTILQHDKMAALVNIGKILGAYEKDNEQKRPELAEALAGLVAELHEGSAGRLKYAARVAQQPAHQGARH